MIIQSDSRHIPLANESVQCVVTSPPYWGLRDYQVAGQIGLESSIGEYVATMVGVFREVRRVLRDDGTVWLNLGDSYTRDPGKGDRAEYLGLHKNIEDSGCHHASQARTLSGLKPKDLCGIPWRIAFALQADGWYLRSDIIWAKPNPMPESVTDRPTRSHEYLFLLSKSERYFYDSAAIAEPLAEASIKRIQQATFDSQKGGPKDYGPLSNRSARQALVNLKARTIPPQIEENPERYANLTARNRRSVWTINSEPYPESHFATFPKKMVEPCILAGSRPRDLVFDPFLGSATVGEVCEALGRRWVGTELSMDYCRMGQRRTAQRGLFRLTGAANADH